MNDSPFNFIQSKGAVDNFPLIIFNLTFKMLQLFFGKCKNLSLMLGLQSWTSSVLLHNIPMLSQLFFVKSEQLEKTEN